MITLEKRPAELRDELNHSCIIGQCPVPCPYSNTIECPEVDVVEAPTMAHSEG